MEQSNKKKLNQLDFLEPQINSNGSDKSATNLNKKIEISTNKAELKDDKITTGIEIKSPIIGTAYLAPEPGGKKFVEIGKKIKKGDTVMIVEAMKTMNHVPSTSDGVVKEICVEDGQPVEFDQKIIVLE